MRAFKAVVDVIKEQAKADPDVHNKLLVAHWYAQTYKFDQFVDLKDLCLRLKDHLRLAECDVVVTNRSLHHQGGLQRLRVPTFARSVNLLPVGLRVARLQAFEVCTGDRLVRFPRDAHQGDPTAAEKDS